jgi:hypothetical protein
MASLDADVGSAVMGDGKIVAHGGLSRGGPAYSVADPADRLSSLLVIVAYHPREGNRLTT